MFPLSLEAKLIGYALAAAALLAAFWAFVSHERSEGAAQVKAAEAQQYAKDIAQAASETDRIKTAQVASDREADKFRMQALADARSAADASDRLQQRFNAINTGCVSEHSAASAGSPAASSPADLRADVLRGVIEAARLAASAADASRAAGQQAVDHYDALTP